MAEWIISSSILILLVAALRYVLRGKITRCFQYAFWGLVLVRLLVPVSFGASALSVMNIVPKAVLTVPAATSHVNNDALTQETTPGTPAPGLGESQSGDVQESNDAQQSGDAQESTVADLNAQAITNTLAGTTDDSRADGASRTAGWNFVARAVWLAGLPAVGLFLLITNLRFSARLKSSRRPLDIVGYPLPIYISDLVETPCMFGLLRPSIYITQEAAHDDTVRRHVLEHEATHYRHGDHIWAAFRGVCLAIHWYNPLVWFAAMLSVRDSELACDESTITRIGEDSRTDYGRSLIGLTSKTPITGALLKIATTMTGSESGIKERIALMANRRKMAPHTTVLVVLAAALLAFGAFTGPGCAVPTVPPSDDNSNQAPNETGAKIYTIPLDDAPFYGPHGIRTEPPVDESDIAEIFAQAETDGVRMLFYRAASGDIWGAFEKADGNIHRFIQAYNAKDQWGYQSNFSVEPFTSLFGQDGFVMGCSFGASYHAYDYYFLNRGGDVELLASCVNNHTVVDLDGDGDSELLYFTHVSAALHPYFYFQREGRLFQVDVASHLYNAFLGWNNIWSDGSVSQDDDGPYLAINFCLGQEEPEYECKVRYAQGALLVEVPADAIPPDGVIWSVKRDGYEVGLRSKDDNTEILLRRGDDIEVLRSLPSNSGTGWRYSLRSFDATPELGGFVLGSLATHGWGNFYYYAVEADSAVCYAQSFGLGMNNAFRDLDGDGIAEMICNVTYGADGVTDVFVYRMKDGVPQVASVTDAVLSIPEGQHLASPGRAVYDDNTGLVTCEYIIAGEDAFRVEMSELIYDSLQFTEFTPDW